MRLRIGILRWRITRLGKEGGAREARQRVPGSLKGLCSRVGGPLGHLFHSGKQDGCELEEELGDSRVSLQSESRKEETGLHGAASRRILADEDDRVCGDAR